MVAHSSVPFLPPFGDHRLKSERYREEWHGPSARMTRARESRVVAYASATPFSGHPKSLEVGQASARRPRLGSAAFAAAKRRAATAVAASGSSDEEAPKSGK